MKLISLPSRGFTLLELLVVFSIIGVLAGVGFAAFTNYSRSQALDQAVQDIKIAIEKTKFNAVSSVKPASCTTNNKTLNGYQIVFNPGNNSYTIYAICSSEQFQISTKAFPNITMVTTGPSPVTTCTTLSYNTLSGYEGAACNIVISGYGRTKQVTVDSGGNAGIQL